VLAALNFLPHRAIQESVSALALLAIGLAGLIFTTQRDQRANWGKKRLAEAVPTWSTVELVLCILQGLMLPCYGGVMQKSLDPFRWSSGIVCPIAWVLVHRRVLVSRGRVGYDVCMRKILPMTWIVSCATFVWSIQSAILIHSLYSGQWRGDTKVRLVVAMIQNMLLCALIIVAVIRPPKRVLDFHSQALKVLNRES